MSKTTLKKELNNLNREQLVEVILTAYSASKETKEYFEFFLNPDASQLIEAQLGIIAKELSRTSRGRAKARISHIRACIRKVENFGCDASDVAGLMFKTIRMLVAAERYYYFPTSLNKGTARLVHDYIVYADKNEILQQAADNISALVADTATGRAYFREFIMQTAHQALSASK